MNVLIWLFLLSYMDMTLTFYQMFLLQKKGVFRPRFEQNPIVRWMVKKGPTPSKYFIGAVYVLPLLYLLSWFCVYVDGDLTSLYVVFGMFAMINIYHWYNISWLSSLWKDDTYWSMYKQTQEHCDGVLK